MSGGELSDLAQLVELAGDLGLPAVLAWCTWHVRGLCQSMQGWTPRVRVELVEEAKP